MRGNVGPARVRNISASASASAGEATAVSAPAAAGGSLELQSSNKVFGGEVRKYSHASESTGTAMTFSAGAYTRPLLSQSAQHEHFFVTEATAFVHF